MVSLFKDGNYFADIEQAAFSPSTMVPGFAASADPGKLYI
jgi:catalase